MLRRRQRPYSHRSDASPDVAVDSHGQRPTPPSARGATDVGVDRLAAALATSQGGVVGRAQLLARGVGPHAIDHRVRTGRFITVFRGVYAVGHAALPDHGRMRAALLAAGPRAALSHRTAAWVHGLLPSLPAVLEVTVTGNPRRSRPGLLIHASRRPFATADGGGLPVTTPLRTLVDLAPVLSAGELERACSDALVRNLVRAGELEASRLVEAGRAAPTRSGLERIFLRVVREAGLPRPEANHTIGPYEVDFAWPRERVLVETDGWAAHGHRVAFERDRARDAQLVARGYAVLRFTWRHVLDRPTLVAAQLAQALAVRAP